MIYYIVYVVFYLISFLVCAIQAGNWYPNGGLIAGAVSLCNFLYPLQSYQFFACVVSPFKFAYKESMFETLL